MRLGKGVTLILVVSFFAALASAESAYDEEIMSQFNYYLGEKLATLETNTAAVKLLSGQKLRCVDYGALSDGVSLGDGFSRVRPNATAAQQRILNAPLDSVIRMDLSEMDGVNIWLLQRLSQIGNFSLEIDVYRLPKNISSSPDKTLSLLYLLNSTNFQPYDCVTTATQLFAYRQAYMTYITPTQPFGYIVTTLEGTPPVIPLLTRFWTWRTPFADEVWGVLACSLVIVGWFMWFFERCDNEDDFGHHMKTPIYEQIWNGVYLAFAGFTSKTEEFSPKTLPGRILGMIHAFSIFLVVSFYIANLATVFITAPAPDQPIQSIRSFSQLGTPACVGNKTAFLSFMNQSHPEVKTAVVSPGVTAVLDAMLLDDPPCLGGVMTDVLFQYETGPEADPNGKYCSALMIGPQMGTNYYAIPFAKSTQNDTIFAINIIVADLIASGEYGAEAAQNFYVDRPQCQTMDSGDAPTISIELEDFSGVFLVQIIGIVAGLITWLGARTCGFTCLRIRKSRGGPVKAGDDVSCLNYFFRAAPTVDDTLPDDIKAIHDIRALLDKLEQKAVAASENGGVGGSPAAGKVRDYAPRSSEQPGKIVLELSSGDASLG